MHKDMCKKIASTSLQLPFLHFVSTCIHTKVILHGQIPIHNSSQPSAMVNGCKILLHVVLYSTRGWYINQVKWIDSEFACFVRLSIVFLEYVFQPFLFFGHQKAKIFSLTGGLTATYTAYSNFIAAFLAMHMFHAHIIWVPSMQPMPTFFFVLTVCRRFQGIVKFPAVSS